MLHLRLAIMLALAPLLTYGRTHLRADGTTNTYHLVSRAFGFPGIEVPDCGHHTMHITQGRDVELKKQVFIFHAHVSSDNDRCRIFDRQRTEIKTNFGKLNGYHGETMTHSWSFKLDAGFQPSTFFTHIHQLKAVGGNAKLPLITITPLKSKGSGPNYLEIIHFRGNNKTIELGRTPLDPFLGVWVHVVEEATYWRGKGIYRVAFKRLDNRQKLWSLSRYNLEMWRKGAHYVQGKWGIYRSLRDKGALRDESVRFDNFCVGKGRKKKCT